MTDICLGFEVHQPLRLDREFDSSNDAKTEDLLELYFDNDWNKNILKRVAEKCYLPANERILENIKRFSDKDQDFKVTFSISGVFLWQCKRWCPEVIESFQKLNETGNVEFLNQTFYHSLASLFSEERSEFKEQVRMHRDIMEELFDQDTVVFENTEFIYNDSIAETLGEMGYKGIFTEGMEDLLGGNSPNQIYKATGTDVKVFPRNYKLSDDIGFRFSNSDWKEYPLTADKYAAWLSEVGGQAVNIFVDYETFGEHQWPETGIFDFLSWLPREILDYEGVSFVKPSQLVTKEDRGNVHVSDFGTISWADQARSTDAWIGNSMQRECYAKLKELGPKVKKINDEDLLEVWRFLQTSDHLYYMYTAPGESKEVHNYFSQQSPYEAYKTMKNILLDFERRVEDLI